MTKSMTRISSQKDNKEEITFVALLKACAKKKNLCKGTIIHADIVRKGLHEKSPCISSGLIRMYAKCGSLLKAQDVHDALLVRSIMSWNALIVCFAQEGKFHESLHYLERVQNESLFPDVITFIFVLKACGSIGAIKKGRKIHYEVVWRGMLKKDIMLSTALVDMYAKCGVLGTAEKVHDDLCARDLISWSALIAGYVRHAQGDDALECFERMQSEGFFPDVVTSSCILKACAIIRDIDKGKEIHDQIVRRGFQKNNVLLGNALVDMYAKCGALLEARHVIEELPIRNVECWSTLIAGYVQAERGQEALRCLEEVQNEGLSPDGITFTCALRACGSIGAIDKGKKIHNEILTKTYLSENVMLGNALVEMYAKCGLLSKAQEVLEVLPRRDVFSWSFIIGECARLGHVHKALYCFEKMEREGVDPDEVTFSCLLKACGSTGMVDKGRQIHDKIIDKKLLQNNIMLCNALVDMYAKCGEFAKAQEVFEELPVRNVISWSALIGGFIQHKQYHEAFHCFEQMQTECVSPNAITFTYILKSCGLTRAITKGKQLHDDIISQGLLKKDIVLGSALVEMYVNCGYLAKAQQVHDGFDVKNVVSWNALILGYVQQGQEYEAFRCLEMMRNECISPDVVTFTSILRACSNTGAMNKGKETHYEIVRRGLLMEKNGMLGTSLVDFYIKCGMLAKAQELHDGLCTKDIVSWNALIGGYAQQRKAHDALNCLEMMQGEGISPDAVTLLCVLNACGRSGFLDNAEMCYWNMARAYDIRPGSEHHKCMIVMWSSGGLFDKAMPMIEMMPASEYPTLWLSLLSACKKWGNARLGRLAFHEVLYS